MNYQVIQSSAAVSHFLRTEDFKIKMRTVQKEVLKVSGQLFLHVTAAGSEASEGTEACEFVLPAYYSCARNPRVPTTA